MSVAPDVTVPTAPAVKTHDKPTEVPSPQCAATNTQVPEVQDGPPSPVSEASSGYFSHSVSTATLSEALAPGLDAAAQGGGQTPGGSPPPVPCRASLETEPQFPSAAPGADSALPATLEGQTRLLSLPVPAAQTPGSAGDSGAPAQGAASSEQQPEEAGTSPAHLPASAPQESPSPQSGGNGSPATKPLGGPREQARPATSAEPVVSKPQLAPDLLSQSPAPASPFRIRKVRTSELKSFTRMLGGDPGCPSEEDPQAAGGPGDGSSGGQTLEKLEVSSDSEEASEVPEWLREGEYVTVGANKVGVVRYIGPTDFQEGTWVGVELDLPSGECCLSGRSEHRGAEHALSALPCPSPPLVPAPPLLCPLPSSPLPCPSLAPTLPLPCPCPATVPALPEAVCVPLAHHLTSELLESPLFKMRHFFLDKLSQSILRVRFSFY